MYNKEPTYQNLQHILSSGSKIIFKDGEADRRGEEVEDWQIDSKLQILNKAHDPPTYFSRRWKTTSTPDLAFSTDNFHTKSKRTLLNQLGGNDHKSIKLTFNLNQQPEDCKMLPRFNYRKGKWDLYSGLTYRYTENTKTKKKDTNKIVKGFNAAVLKNGTWRRGRRTLRRKLASDKTDPQKIK